MARVQASQGKPVIGLTGGIGAGKSAVAAEFERLGAKVLDFDRLAHEELGHEDVVASLREWWGDGILDPEGRVNRSAVATIVFDHPEELARLEGLLYPRLAELRKRHLAQLQNDATVKAVVLDAPKLMEAGLDRHCDALVFVDADRCTRLQRVREARGWTEAELDRREKLQKPLDSKRASADYVVINHTSTEHLRSQVERVFNSVLASFS